jgi:hypothetical protein
MPAERRPRKIKRVDQNVMSEPSLARADAPPERVHAPGARKEDWIANHLKRVYDEALSDAIPQEMLDLLNALDDVEQDPDKDGSR